MRWLALLLCVGCSGGGLEPAPVGETGDAWDVACNSAQLCYRSANEVCEQHELICSGEADSCPEADARPGFHVVFRCL